MGSCTLRRARLCGCSPLVAVADLACGRNVQVFYDATQYFSRAGKDAPDLTDVIPAMDIIDQKLATGSLNQALDPAIRVALSLGKRSMNHYYNKSNKSAAYRIAMVLDPRHKLQYFRDNAWPDRWIAEARALVRQAYDEEWKGHAVSREQAEDAEEPQPLMNAQHASSSKKANMFDAARASRKKATVPIVDELDHYLSTDANPAINSALVWWTSRESRATYPNLSRMAISYLTIPPTSVAVERLFSKGRIFISHLRNGLSAASIRALLCLNNWSTLGFIKDEDVMSVMREDASKESPEDVEDVWGFSQPNEDLIFFV
ncbi:hypothetical protein EVJ58_g11062 [Rhodofomes roseus]|uniref:HAT C-terminal dimerisation domain-containing protein n=1 Tax=Rhodofomes roseus TaxID=34475 RepID=A0A4Y9XJU0_9APHY|nr:hypothetical protein EVJ58_g11062 [Rhodofomes roseus]